jgi:DNA polymerase
MKVNGLNLNNMQLNIKEFEIRRVQEEIRNCYRCRLSETRIHALPGEGDLDARIMLIAQAPGEKENKNGSMFIGPSGRILDELLDNIGVSRDSLYMTNLVKCMLPKYRKPRQDEIEACSIYLDMLC